MGISRRAAALKGIVVAGGRGGAAPRRRAQPYSRRLLPTRLGLLYDATLCIGCKTCVVACQDANGLPPDTTGSPTGIYNAPVDLNAKAQTVIKLYQDENGDLVRESAVHALRRSGLRERVHARRAQKTRVRHRQLRPVDSASAAATARSPARSTCRSFEWAQATPQIVKCELCRERLAAGKEPACTEVCPRKAVIFGKRSDSAEGSAPPDRRDRRIVHPEGVRRNRGRRNAVPYISHVPFDKLGLPALGDAPAPPIWRGRSSTASTGVSSRRSPCLRSSAP